MLQFLLTITDEEYRSDIERLYKRYHESMMIFALSKMKDARRKNFVNDAEDAVQNTFMRITRFIGNIDFSRGERDVKNYCFSILHNEISNILKENEIFFENFEEFCSENEYNFIEGLEIQERYDEVVKAVRSLDKKYSSTLYFVYFEGMTVNEIAEMMGISTQTVYSRLARGKQLLLNSLKGATIND